MTPVIHWFRRDLRLSDNLALRAALKTGQPVIPLFIFDPALLKGERFSAARLKFMLDGLRALDESLKPFGTRLLIRHGSPIPVLSDLIETTKASALFYNRDYSPYAVRRDHQLSTALSVDIHAFDDALLHPPGQILSGSNAPYTVYTPFKRRWLEQPKPTVESGVIPNKQFHSLEGLDNSGVPTLRDLGVRETIDTPPAGEMAARQRLERFVARGIFLYSQQRDDLAINPFTSDDPTTSALSPYFRFGMISPRQAYQAAMTARREAAIETECESVDVWISELAWREFYTHILYHFPHVYNSSFRPEYEQVEYRHVPDELRRWQNGETGYPIVDAAMRQLNALGWMHNRARMIVASFLTKDLLIYWREGDVIFMQRLIDGDPAANNGGWQWSAGTGTDAQPYFRIFNPVSQSQKFDPDGIYIRHWLPELRDVPTRFIHAPWEMETPPANYPRPIVDHAFARERTLRAYKAVKQEEPT
jgi:deoxyribodipyrimidine photo-lyase